MRLSFVFYFFAIALCQASFAGESCGDSLRITHDRDGYAGVTDVVLASSEIVEYPQGEFTAKRIDFKFILEIRGYEADVADHIEEVSEAVINQPADMNYNELFLKVAVRNEEDYQHATAHRQDTVVEHSVYLGQKYMGDNPDKDREWFFSKRAPEQYFNFYRGMERGINIWSLYRLDFSDPEKPSFELVKHYYIEKGEASEIEPEF